MRLLQFRTWVKVTRTGDWWIFATQPGEVVDGLLEIEALAATLGPQMDLED